MKYSWNYRLDKKSVLFAFFPIVFILARFNREETIYSLFILAFLGITTLVQILKSRQKNVLSIEHRKMYKKNIFGNKKEYDLQKYKEFSIDGSNKQNTVMVGYYLDENQKIHKETLLRNEYQATLDEIKRAIDESLSISGYIDEEEDFFFYQEKQTYLKENPASLEQESYRKTIKVANIVLAACYMFVAGLTLVYLENTVEGILAMFLITYILIMFSVSKKILDQDISVPEKRKYNLMLYLPGIILMLVIAVMIFDN